MPVDHADLMPKQIRTCARDGVGGPYGFFKIVPGSGSLIHHQCSRDAYHYAG